jgi:phosphate transport system substrate-binding protein
MREFLEEYVSDTALGADGYMAERGLTPLAPEKLKELQKAVLEGKKFGS